MQHFFVFTCNRRNVMQQCFYYYKRGFPELLLVPVQWQSVILIQSSSDHLNWEFVFEYLEMPCNKIFFGMLPVIMSNYSPRNLRHSNGDRSSCKHYIWSSQHFFLCIFCIHDSFTNAFQMDTVRCRIWYSFIIFIDQS